MTEEKTEERPSYIQCIVFEREKESVCGRKLQPGERFYPSIDDWFITQGCDLPMGCPHCLYAVVKAAVEEGVPIENFIDDRDEVDDDD